jgi:hypothetical protein
LGELVHIKTNRGVQARKKTNPRSLDQLNAELELIADWKEQAAERADRAQRILEAVGLTPALHQALADELRLVTQLCNGYAARVRRAA